MVENHEWRVCPLEKIRHDLRLSATLDAVYNALVTPEGLRGWWSKNSDVSTQVKDQHELRFDKSGREVVMRFRIDVLEPRRRVSWTCTENGNPAWVGTTLTWEIAPMAEGSLVRFVHEGFAQRGPLHDSTVEGWQHFMKSLKSYVETGVGQPW